MKKPFSQLYDDFFSESINIQETKPIEKPQVKDVSFPNEKHQLNKYILSQDEALEKLEKAIKRPSLMDKKDTTMLVCGPKGSGKHTLLKRYHEFLYAQNYLKAKHPTFINLNQISDEATLIQDLYSALQTPYQMIVFENIITCDFNLLQILLDLCKDGILPLKQRYSIAKDKLVVASGQLEKNLISKLSSNHHYFVFLENGSFSQISSTLGNHFINIIQDVIETQPVSKDHLLELLQKDLVILASQLKENTKKTFQWSDEAKQYLVSSINKEEGYHDLKEKLEKIHHLLINVKDDPCLLQVKDNQLFINDTSVNQKDSLQDVLNEIQKEMDEIVGLEEVKKYIYSLRDFIQISKRRQAQGLKTDEISMHMIFTGNPGTGKTTMARLMAKYLKALGILKNGQLLEVTRADLVASYVGQTAPKTKQVIESSLGGVLFIDEAYSLYRGKEDSFGLEAIDMLVKGMEDHRDDLLVVLAGYTKEMQTFLEANSGLKSRFANVIEFPDYTAQQLLEIAISQAKKKEYTITQPAQEKLLEYFTFMQSLQDKRSGNGRLARNVVEDAILKQASRIVQDLNASLTELTLEDFELNN